MHGEARRIRAHLEGAFDALVAHVPEGLAPTAMRRRAEMTAALRRYIDGGVYPTNRAVAGRTPVFVDPDGARCAVAALMEASGHVELVERIARDHNLAYVRELEGDVDLRRWLADHGLTLAEAARIQPAYADVTATTWQPTVSVLASAQSGEATSEGAQAALAVGARLGARRVRRSRGACERCVYETMAWVAEYTRTVVVGVGATNQVALLMQADLEKDPWIRYKAYAFGGPLASIDEAARPGFGVGAEAGVGVRLRSVVLPVFGELGVAGLGGGSQGFAARGGVTVGVGW